MWCEVLVQIHFLHVDIQLSQNHLLKCPIDFGQRYKSNSVKERQPFQQTMLEQLDRKKEKCEP